MTFYKYVIVYKCLEQVHNINMQCYNLVSEYCDFKKNTLAKAIFTERGFIWLTFSSLLSLISRKSRQELKAASDPNAENDVAHYGLDHPISIHNQATPTQRAHRPN